MKVVKIIEHGTAYFIKNKTLFCCPLDTNNKPIKESYGMVEESPSSFMTGHTEALLKLGIEPKDVKNYTEKIDYYDNHIHSFIISSKDLFDKKKNPNLSLSAKDILANEKIKKRRI